MNRFAVKLGLFTSLIAFFPLFAMAVELVRDGKPVAAIVIPAKPLAVESYAARELQYHVVESTGATLPILSESPDVTPGGHIYLGRAASAKIDAASLSGNSYVVETIGSDLYISGKDSSGSPLDTDSSEGTLFGVYDILERDMGVRWLWPGKLGEFIPRRKDLTLTPKEGTVTPLLWFKHWRSGKAEGELVWLKRQRFGRSRHPQYGHSFTEYWSRFHDTHPEYFAMLPDGTRGLDPAQDSNPEYLHVCVSQPALVKQIVADWKSRGMPEFLNVCENDGWAGCACSNCLAWDEPDADNPIPFDQRLAAARRAYAGKLGRRDEWMLQFGSLSDRYARFWKIVADEARPGRPDVKVISYAYDNYRQPPVKARLGPNVVCGLVPQESIFGYSQLDSAVFRNDWSGWEKTGCALFLRPNYTLQMPNFPAFYARTLGEDLKFAMARGLEGTDFDSLMGKYSTQGPSLYMLAAALNHPDAPVDQILEDFYAAFGPAKDAVKNYFAFWESIYPNYPATAQAEKIKTKRKYGAGLYGPFYLLADEIYTPAVMANARSLLDKARQAGAGDQAARARIDWLGMGLRQAELMLATQRAYEQKIDTGDKTEFLAAYAVLNAFRNENAAYDATNFAGLGGEERVWEKAAR